MSRVLVLGGTGFIGAAIVRELEARGRAVSVLARPGSDRSLLKGTRATIHEGDMENPHDLQRALESADSLVHAAAYYPSYSLGKEKQVQIAVQQVRGIIDAAAHAGVNRFVFLSSPSAVGVYPDGRPEDEHALFPAERLRGTYNSIKRAMQDWVLAEANRVNGTVIAPTGVFGPGDRKPTTGRLLLEIARGKMPIALEGKINVVDVRNVARGTVEAFENGSVGRLYVLGGENTTIPAFIEQVARIAGVKPPSRTLNPETLVPLAWATEWAGRFLGRRVPKLPIVSLDFARYGTHLSSAVAEEELGYNPRRYTTQQTIEDALAWFREKGYLKRP